MQIADWKGHVNRLNNVEADLSFEVAQGLNRQVNEMLLDLDNLVPMIETSLVMCDYLAKCLMLKSDIHPKFKDGVRGIMKSNLEMLVEQMTKDKYLLDEMGYERFMRLDKNIKEVADLEDKQNLGFIFSKLDFSDLS